jgi:hypothetical protein
MFCQIIDLHKHVMVLVFVQIFINFVIQWNLQNVWFFKKFDIKALIFLINTNIVLFKEFKHMGRQIFTIHQFKVDIAVNTIF